MLTSLFKTLRCPVTRSPLRLQSITDIAEGEILEGILFADEYWFYPVIKGIPRLIVEAFIDYEDFLAKHVDDYFDRRKLLEKKYSRLISYVTKKNRRTKNSFSLEWKIFDYEKDRTWDQNSTGMISRFLEETDETLETVKGKMVFDAGCGNGLLDEYVAQAGAIVLAMDFSLSIEKAYERRKNANAFFVQGDIEFPPVRFEYFDIVHCSGVLVCTRDPELSFSCIEPCVKKAGKLSVWLYRPRKNFIHNLFNTVRRITSKLPLGFQYYFYLVTLFPASFIIKRLKGNNQNIREMMIDILDWFSPEFRWEHEPSEARAWFHKRNYGSIKITTVTTFGFNIIGIKGEISTNEHRNI